MYLWFWQRSMEKCMRTQQELIENQNKTEWRPDLGDHSY
jgi:hypothetical protein